MSDLNQYVDADVQYPEPEASGNPEPQPEPATPALAPEPEPVQEPAPVQEPPAPVTEEAPSVNPYEEQFRQLGLDKQFPGGLPDLLNRVPYMNKWQTQLSQENAEYRRQQMEMQHQAPPPPQQADYDPNKFYENPYPVLDNRYPTREEVAALSQELTGLKVGLVKARWESFEKDHPDATALLPQMDAILRADPGIAGLKDPLPHLYNEARKMVNPNMQAVAEKAKQQVTKTIEDKSIRAETTGSGPKAPPTPRVSQADLYKMPLDKLRDYFGGYKPED